VPALPGIPQRLADAKALSERKPASKASASVANAVGMDLAEPVAAIGNARAPQVPLTHGEPAGSMLPGRRADSGPGRIMAAEGARRLLVLLAEDNDIGALLARHLLERAGCQVKICSNGQDAVDAMRRAIAGEEPAYDLVLMDAHMPVLDGLEATKQIRKLYRAKGNAALPSPPIIAVTASAFEEDRRRCLAAGMDDYLAKPFDAEELSGLIDRWCRGTWQQPTP
jgi:CheY-like chemotaxis protein